MPPADYEVLSNAVKRIMTERNLQPEDSFVTKVLEAQQMFLVRHGFMIVGLPFAGRCTRPSVTARSLLLTLMQSENGDDDIVRKVGTSRFNPAEVPPGRLYGEFDLFLHEWFDGILAGLLYREASAGPLGRSAGWSSSAPLMPSGSRT